MSYDLAVFDPAAAPRNAQAFTEWYDSQAEWDPGNDDCYNPAIATPALRAWFLDMIKEFPAMNGPFAKPGGEEDDEAEARTSEYGIAPSLIYVGFAWSMAQEAYEACTRLGAKHGVGFIDVSSDDSDVLFPDKRAEERYVRAFSLVADE